MATFLRIKGDEAIFGLANGNRYLFIPYVMVCWAILSVIKKRENNYFLFSLLVLILASSLASSFRTQYIDYNWRFYAQKIGIEPVHIPINPPGWTISLDIDPDKKTN
jgi:hypothetical protein